MAAQSKRAHFSPEFFTFFRQLKRNNNREWFQRHKARYETVVRDPFLEFIEDFRPRLHRISPHFMADPRPSGGSLLRIYRDLRFRPEADPYKTMAAARFPHDAWKQTAAPGLYLHLETGRCFLGAGLWHPEPEPRNILRRAIADDPKAWKRATQSRKFKAVGQLGGDSATRMPVGFDPEHPLAEDLKRKDFIAWSEFTDAEVCRGDFIDRVTRSCEGFGPFLEFLTRALSLPWTADERLSIREVSQVEKPRLS